MIFGRRAMRWVGIGAVVLAPIAYLDNIDRFVQLPQILVLHVAALAGLMAWFFVGTWRRSSLVLPALFFCFFEILSIAWAHTPVFSVLPIATHLAGLLLFLALLNGLEDAGFQSVVSFACGTAAVVSVFGVLHFWGIGQTWVPTAGLPSATLGHRNIAAAYLVGAIPLTFWCWLKAPSIRTSLGWAIALGLESAFLLATRSRGAWVGLALAVLVVVFFVVRSGALREVGIRNRLPQKQTIGLLVALMLAVGIAGAPARIEKGAGEAMWQGKQNLGDAVVSIAETGGDKGRWALWLHTAEMIVDHPLLGVGAGHWRLVYPAYSQGDVLHARAVPHRPHNDLLWIWSETGVLGILAYMWLLGAAIRAVPSGGRTALDWVLLSVLLATVTNSLFSFPRAFPAAWLPFYLALAGIGIRAGMPVRPFDRRHVLIGAAILTMGLSTWTVMRHIHFDRAMLATRVAFSMENWPRVLASVEQALTFGPLDEELFLMRGRAYAETQRPKEALADYQAGLRLHPNSVGLWNGAGQMLRATGDFSGARQAYRQALQIDPVSGETHNNLGTLFAMAGQLDSAQVAFERAISCEPGLVEAYANLSHTYRRLGDPGRALDVARRGLVLAPTHLETRAAEGSALLALRQFAAAAHAFSQVISEYPARTEFYFNLGQAYDGMGQLDGAISSYKTFLDTWHGGAAPQVDLAKKRLSMLENGRRTTDDGRR